LRLRIFSIVPGFLAFLGYYEVLSGLAAPLRFTVGRVTNTYLARIPLLGSLEADFVAYLLASSLVSRTGGRRLHAVLVALSASILLLCRLHDLAAPVHLGIGLAALLSAWMYARRRGASSLLPGVLVSTAAVESSALLALSAYYAAGSWAPIPFQLLLRERLIWAPLEWGLAPLFIAGMWIALAAKAVNRGLTRFLEAQPHTSKNCGNPRRILMLAVIITCMLIVLPHLPTVNPGFRAVSVDTVSYKVFFDEVGESDVWEALRKSPERPMFIFIIYQLWRGLSRNSILLMDLAYPLLALNLLTLTSYYVGLRLGGPSTAGWASLLVPLGHMVTAFIGGGFQANSLALTPAILALTIDPRSRGGTLKLSALLSLVALLHPWTYLMYVSTLIFRALRERARLSPTLIAVAFSYTVSQTADYTLGRIIVAETATKPVIAGWGLYLPSSWFDTFQLYVWNTLSNPLYLSTALLAMEPTIASTMAVAAPLTLVLPASLIYRLVLNIPAQIQASEAMKNLRGEERGIILLALLARTLGNLSGLTPLEETLSL
jgi:hypothetical protein